MITIPTIYINSVNAKTTYGMELTDTALDIIYKAAPAKKHITNKSMAQDGASLLTSYHKIDERSLSLPVVIRATSESDYIAKYNSLFAELNENASFTFELKNGTETTIKMYLSYEDMTSYVHFNGKWAKLILKLNEYNPANRI